MIIRIFSLPVHVIPSSSLPFPVFVFLSLSRQNRMGHFVGNAEIIIVVYLFMP